MLLLIYNRNIMKLLKLFKKNKFSSKASKIILYTNGLILLSGAMLGPIYAFFVEDIGGSLLDASYAFAIFSLSAGVVTILSGKYVDKIKENELILVVGYSIIGSGFILYTIVNSIILLFLVQIIIGIGEAISWPAFDVLYNKHIDKNNPGKWWGIWESLNYFTISIGALAGGFLVTYFGFNIMFIIMGFLCLFSAMYIFILPRKLL